MAYTTIDNPELYFQSVLWTGNGSNPRTITFGGDENMQPDLLWYKCRSHAVPHILLDSVRGAGNDKELQPDDTTAEGGTSADADGYISAFTSNGFTLTEGSSGDHYTNEGSRTFVAWGWKMANGTASNSNGTNITSTVSANTTAGQSIVSYSGSGTTSDTVGHGLSSLDLLIVKSRGENDSWFVKHKDLASSKNLNLNQTVAETDVTSAYSEGGLSNLSGNTFGFLDGTSDANAVNESSEAHIAYCFKSVQGYSKFGSYKGGTLPFIYLGFKPAYFLLKEASATNGYEWVVFDNARDSNNPIGHRLNPSHSRAEYTDLSDVCDFNSNGLKFRSQANNWCNTDGRTYIYMAFAEAPFVNSKGVPCNAR